MRCLFRKWRKSNLINLTPNIERIKSVLYTGYSKLLEQFSSHTFIYTLDFFLTSNLCDILSVLWVIIKCQMKDLGKLIENLPFLGWSFFFPGWKFWNPILSSARDNCRKNRAGICGEQFGTLSSRGNENSYEEFSAGWLAGLICILSIRRGAICIPGTEYLQCQRLPSHGDDVPTIP